MDKEEKFALFLDFVDFDEVLREMNEAMEREFCELARKAPQRFDSGENNA